MFCKYFPCYILILIRIHKYYFVVLGPHAGPESDGNEDVILKVWEKCEEESKSVEVVYKNANEEEILTKVHFQFSPKVHKCTKNVYTMHSHLPLQRKFKEEVTSRVKWNVDRSSQDDKLRDFLHWMNALKKNTIHQVKQ